MAYQRIIGAKIDQDGISIHVEHEKYPRKGYPQASYVHGVAIVKRLLMLGLKLCSNPLIAFIFFLSRKRLIREFVLYGDVMFDMAQSQLRYLEGLGQYYEMEGKKKQNVIFLPQQVFTSENFLKPEIYCKSVKELYRIGDLLTEGENQKKILAFTCMILEFDDAYRYRFQDAFGTSKSVGNGIKLLIEREGDDNEVMLEKLNAVLSVYKFLTLISPRFCKFIKDFEKEVNWDLIKLDDADFYHALPKGHYKFKGLSQGEREVIKRQIDEYLLRVLSFEACKDLKAKGFPQEIVPTDENDYYDEEGRLIHIVGEYDTNIKTWYRIPKLDQLADWSIHKK